MPLRDLRREQASYQLAAIAATSGVVTLAIVATYLRFQWHHDEDIPWQEVVATLMLVAGGVVSKRAVFSHAPRNHMALTHTLPSARTTVHHP